MQVPSGTFSASHVMQADGSCCCIRRAAHSQSRPAAANCLNWERVTYIWARRQLISETAGIPADGRRGKERWRKGGGGKNEGEIRRDRGRCGRKKNVALNNRHSKWTFQGIINFFLLVFLNFCWHMLGWTFTSWFLDSMKHQTYHQSQI